MTVVILVLELVQTLFVVSVVTAFVGVGRRLRRVARPGERA